MIRKNLVGLYLGRPIMAHKNLVGLYLGRTIMCHEILWAFSWASPLWSAKSRGPLAGPAHYDPQEFCGPLPGPAHYGNKNLVGLYLGRPIMARKILWAFSWAGPFKLDGPVHVSTYHRRVSPIG